MCRNIRTLFNFEPPATELEIRDASLQFVRKLSGFNVPSQANAAAFDQAVEEVADAARRLIASLVTHAPPKNREAEAAKARANRILAEAETSPNYQRLLDRGDARDVGDLTAAGDEGAILARFRAQCPCESLLMDEATVERWRDLAVSDRSGGSVDAAWLTEAERAALDVLRREGLRLEQERIPIGAAVKLLVTESG